MSEFIAPRKVCFGRTRWRVRSDAAGDLLPALERGIERLFDGATLLKDKRYRRIYRAALPDTGREIIIKHFRNRDRRETLKRSLLPTTALREWALGLAMIEQGLPTPAPLAVGHTRRGLRLETCYLVQEALEAPRSLREIVDGGLDARRRRALAKQAAALVRRMHDAEFQHTDLHAENLLLAGPEDDAEMYVVDMQAVRRRKMDFYRRCEDLARLNASLRRSPVTRADRLRFLRAYLAAAPFGPREEKPLREWWCNLADDMARVLRDYYRGRTKRCLVNSTLFAVERTARDVLYRRRAYAPDEVRAVIAAHHRCLRGGEGAVLKRTRHSNVTLAPDPHDRARRLCVKEVRARRFLHRLKDLLRRPPAMREWVAARGLAVRDLPAPEAVAYLRPRIAVPAAAHYLVTRELPGAVPLNLYAARRAAAWTRAQRLRLVEGLADFCTRLFRRDVVHGDLKASNVLVLEHEDDVAFALVDLGAMRFRAPRVHDVVRSLAQLHASLPLAVTRADRLRFLRRHLEGIGKAHRERAILRAVLRESARKTQVWERL